YVGLCPCATCTNVANDEVKFYRRQEKVVQNYLFAGCSQPDFRPAGSDIVFDTGGWHRLPCRAVKIIVTGSSVRVIVNVAEAHRPGSGKGSVCIERQA